MIDNPRLSIGLPVYNGDEFIEFTLDSLLTQTFPNFELIISDNCSTDRTEQICRARADRDERIRYIRSERNLGAAWNYNRVFALSQGEYFKWAAHDDLYANTFLEKCVSVLDEDRSLVLCCARSTDIDEDGNHLAEQEYRLHMDSTYTPVRFRELTRMDHTCEAIFGVIRRHMLEMTPLIGSYADSDRVLLAELALHGPFFEIPENLFFYREHDKRSTRKHPGRYERTVWFDPKLKGRILFPHFRQFAEYLSCLHRTPLRLSDRLRCYWCMIGWLRINAKRLRSDLLIAAKEILRPIARRYGLR